MVATLLHRTTRRSRWFSGTPLAMIALVIACIVSTTGCRGTSGAMMVRPGSEPATASSAWPTVLIAAQSDVDRGRHADADRTLREFGAEYARSPEAVECTYWRAVFMLDPANTSATPRDAGTLLDRYLGSGGPLMHRAEALVLQRIAKSLATRDVAAPAPTRGGDPARDAEVKALKDELEQTKAELERIKKRVAPPPAPPATPPPLPDAE
jgi:hypothetical protein